MKKQLEANLRPQQNSMAVIQSRVLCLVGSSGSGKTSTLAKLAAYYTKTLEKKVVWVCADTIRAAAISETKTYTDVLNIPLFFAYSPQELSEIIQDQTEADLILVDTTGISMVDEDRIVELGSYLSVSAGTFHLYHRPSDNEGNRCHASHRHVQPVQDPRFGRHQSG